MSNTETVIFVYDAEGKLIAEYANQLSQTPQVSYLTADALGSPRIKTDASGQVIARNDYLPFGEDLYTSQRTLGNGYKPDDVRRKFTTYKRDAETGLDFAEARYYSSRWGRFVSPDEFTGGPDELFDFADDASDNPTFYAELTNPQSLNKYQYTYNNPLNLTDPTGHCPFCLFGGAQTLTPRPIIQTTVGQAIKIVVDGTAKIIGTAGRTIVRTQSIASTGDVFSDTHYDNMGRVKKVTNPYRTGETVYWTESFYDDLGRVTKVKTPDNAEVTTAYALATTGSQIGTVVTVTDQALKQRRSVTNALGQLKRVDEPDNNNSLGTIDAPTQPTLYSYDPLSNLATVTQTGTTAAQCGGGTTPCTQVRSFAYDPLSRLKTATNPESGAINYSYDNNGNLQTKIDARDVKTTYGYDALNRVTSRTYTLANGSPLPSDLATPAVSYFYDNLTNNAKGKLIKVSSGVSTTEFIAYDTMGRVTAHKQTTDGTAYTTAYGYNLSGGLLTETYPSGRVVKNVLDNNGDLSMVQSKKSVLAGYWNYAENFTYTAAGAVSSMHLGNGKWESTVFNSRLQPTQIALGTVQNGTDNLKLNFAYNSPASTTDNNGNVVSQTITVPTETRGTTTYNAFTASHNYTYDSLNRIKTATETIPSQTGWKQTFDYDRFGNRRFNTDIAANTTTLPAGCQTAVCNPQINPATNKLVGYTFDNAGNTTRDAQSRKFTYDAENKQTKVETVDANGNVTSTIGEYAYDGDGKRVKKVVGAETTIFVYDASGKMVAEYSTTVAPASTAKVSYLTSDHLGSPRITTDANGGVSSRRDFMPFGEEIAATGARAGYGTDTVRQKFTAYERDNESGLDFAQTRMYSYNHGRFTSPDDFMNDSSVSDPQSWNKYIYVRNNPMKYIDTNGEEATVKIKTDEKKKTIEVTMTASIIYYAEGEIDQARLDQAATNASQNIANAWTGSYVDENGYTVNVTTSITYAVVSNKEEAEKYASKHGMQNVVGFADGPVDDGADSTAGPGGLFAKDQGRWNINTTGSAGNRTAGHEFGHLIGIGNKDNETGLMWARGADNSNPTISTKATSKDFGYAFRDEIRNHQRESRPYVFYGGRFGGGGRSGDPKNHTSTVTLRAPKTKWGWR